MGALNQIFYVLKAVATFSFKKSAYLAAKIHTAMNNLILGAFYDNINKNVGPTLMWVFSLLLTIELIYVMAKYLGTGDKKK